MSDPKKSAPPADAKPVDAKKDVAAPAGASEPHIIRARVFAMEFMLGHRVELSRLVGEADRVVKYLTAGKPSPEIVEARIMAVKVSARGQVAQSMLIEHARPIEQYLLSGKVPPKAVIPAAAGEAPAEDLTPRGSQVPGNPGEAGDEIQLPGRPSARAGVAVVE